MSQWKLLTFFVFTIDFMEILSLLKNILQSQRNYIEKSKKITQNLTRQQVLVSVFGQIFTISTKNLKQSLEGQLNTRLSHH